MKISVIIPNYNRSAFLKKAIQSSLNQTYPVHEILICDDGSIDNSLQMVQQHFGNEPKVKWISCGKNGGPAIPRNIGIKNATGDWIAFLDNDDEWRKDKVALQINRINETSSKAICCNAYRLMSEKENRGEYLQYSQSKITFDDLLQTNWVICSSMMLHKSVLSKVGGFPESSEFRAIEDYALWLRVGLFENIDYISTPLVNYLDLPQSSIRNAGPNEWEQKKILLKDLMIWCEENKIKAKKYIYKIRSKYREVTYMDFKYQMLKKLYKIKAGFKF